MKRDDAPREPDEPLAACVTLPPPLPMPSEDLGILDIERALFARSRCFVCDSIVAKGALRLVYRLKKPTYIRYARYIHCPCVAIINATTRARDI